MRRIISCGGILVFALAASAPLGGASVDVSDVHVKKAIADRMTPSELEAYKVRLAGFAAQKKAKLELRAQANAAARTLQPLAPSDLCTGTTFEVGALPYGPIADTTVGAVDNYDLPADTTNPTCTAPVTCTGTGTAGSLPRGAIYTGTGTGPDRAWKIRTSAACTLSITMDPTGSEDLALIVYLANCSSSLADCACVSDSGTGGIAETISLTTVAATDYFIVVDGYSTGATPPGPSGAYTLAVTGTGCSLVPVKLEKLAVD